MSEELPDRPGPDNGEPRPVSENIPAAVEALVAKVAALETTVATLGSEIETLKAGG